LNKYSIYTVCHRPKKENDALDAMFQMCSVMSR